MDICLRLYSSKSAQWQDAGGQLLSVAHSSLALGSPGEVALGTEGASGLAWSLGPLDMPSWRLRPCPCAFSWSQSPHLRENEPLKVNNRSIQMTRTASVRPLLGLLALLLAFRPFSFSLPRAMGRFSDVFISPKPESRRQVPLEPSLASWAGAPSLRPAGCHGRETGRSHAKVLASHPMTYYHYRHV